MFTAKADAKERDAAAKLASDGAVAAAEERVRDMERRKAAAAVREAQAAWESATAAKANPAAKTAKGETPLALAMKGDSAAHKQIVVRLQEEAEGRRGKKGRRGRASVATPVIKHFNSMNQMAAATPVRREP